VAGRGSFADGLLGPVVTAGDMVAGHVSLDISCVDRLYLNGYVPGLQTPGGVVYFLHDVRGHPIASPALFEQIGSVFRARMRAWAAENEIPVLRFTAGVRKADVVAPLLAAARERGDSKVVALGLAQEYAMVWSATKRETDPGKCPQFSYAKTQRRVSVYYVYVWDEQAGPGFIRSAPTSPIRSRCGSTVTSGPNGRPHTKASR